MIEKIKCWIALFVTALLWHGVYADSPPDLDEDDDEESSDLLEISGSIVLQYNSQFSTNGRFGNDPYALLGLTLTPHEKFQLETLLLQARDFEFDEAYAVFHVLDDEQLDLSFGREYLPFGKYDTQMISDPLTQIMGDIRGEEVFRVSSQQGAFSGSLYNFEGTSSIGGGDKHRQGYGLSLTYGDEDRYVGIDYISNLAESNQFSSNDVFRDIPGIAVHGATEYGRYRLVGEYLTVSRDLKPGDLDGEITERATPASLHLEVDIDLEKERTLALAWHKTRGTDELEVDDTRKFYGITYSQPVYKHLTGAIEVASFIDPDNERDNSVNVQLVYDF